MRGSRATSLIRPAAIKLAARLAELDFAVPEIPVVNNVDVAIESEPARIKDALIRQAFSPVRWVEIVQKIVAITNLTWLLFYVWLLFTYVRT